MSTFAAIDFETANSSRDSACAVGVVIVSEGRIVQRVHHLIRPPNSYFQFTDIHGISWEDVEFEPTFNELWPGIYKYLKDVEFLAAHNAPFDRSVLEACCSLYGITYPSKPFHCTVQIARSHWDLYPTKLPNVCNHLKIDLDHHEALSDAEACAKIILAAQEIGWSPKY